MEVVGADPNRRLEELFDQNFAVGGGCSGHDTILLRKKATEMSRLPSLYVDENDPTEMADAITRLLSPDVRTEFVERGLRQASRFSFDRMAHELANAFIETHDRLLASDIARPNPAWAELREYQQRCQSMHSTGEDVDRPPCLVYQRAHQTGNGMAE